MEKLKGYLNLLLCLILIVLFFYGLMYLKGRTKMQPKFPSVENLPAAVISDSSSNEKMNRLNESVISLVKGKYEDWQLFKAIRKQTGAVFYYSSNNVPATFTIEAALEKITVEKALQIIFKDKPVKWKYSGRKAIILSKKA